MPKKQASKIKKIWTNYNLSIVLALLFAVSWLGQFFVELRQVTQEAQQHGKAFEWGNFWVQFWSSTLQNWQSEFLQLFTFVVLTSFLIHKNSHESKDSQERLERKVDEILKKFVKQDK
jgi:hypothetical protein